MNALSMRKKNSHVKLDIPSQVDDPITFGLGGSSCFVEETPVEVEPVPTKSKNRRKQKKPSRREPSIKVSNSSLNTNGESTGYVEYQYYRETLIDN